MPKYYILCFLQIMRKKAVDSLLTVNSLFVGSPGSGTFGFQPQNMNNSFF